MEYFPMSKIQMLALITLKTGLRGQLGMSPTLTDRNEIDAREMTIEP